MRTKHIILIENLHQELQKVIEFIFKKISKLSYLIKKKDSPGLPISSNSHEMFRGFSFIAPVMFNETPTNSNNNSVNTTLMSSSSSSNSVGNAYFLIFKKI